MNSHLTVNFGLRWELLPPFEETNGDIATYLTTGNNLTVVVPDKFSLYRKQSAPPADNTGFLQGFNACSLTGKTPLLPCSNIETASQAGLPQGLRDWNWRDFDPRVSIAYRPFNNNKTVIRAGFGIYTMTTLGPMSFNSGIIALSDLLTYNNSVTNGVAAFQFPQTSPPGAAATLGGGDFEEANDPHWKDPSSAQWNLTVEREADTQHDGPVELHGPGRLPSSHHHRPQPNSGEHHALHHSEQRILSRRSSCALPELAFVDGVGEHRHSKLSVGYSGSHP